MYKRTEELLRDKGIIIPEVAQSNIYECNEWYKGELTAFHSRHSLGGYDYDLLRLNFAKRVCSDEAGLCEIINLNAEDKTADEFINSVLKANRFDTMYREQLESMSATGTVGAYVYIEGASLYDNGEIRGGNIKVSYCKAENIIPITVENNGITECAFTGSNMVNGKREDKVIIYRIVNGKYQVEIVTGTEKDTIVEPAQTLGDVRPFAVMRLAEVNNKPHMKGYGYPKLLDSIPYLKGLELAYNVLYGDIDKADKVVLINSALTETDSKGKHYLSDEQKKYFVSLSEKLPEQDSMIKEYNPVIRATELTEVFELVLSLLSQQYGYGNKKYSFEHGTVTTATQYILEKSAEMQSLNKQRFQSVQYIEDIVKAILWFTNTYQDKAFNIDEPLNIDFDDSIITDKQAHLDSMRTDAITFDIPQLKITYLCEKYGWTEKEAKGYIEESDLDIETPESIE